MIVGEHGALCTYRTLFPDVINCGQTSDLEMKKLVYLYLTQFARDCPDVAILSMCTLTRVSIECNDTFGVLSTCAYMKRSKCVWISPFGPYHHRVECS